MSRPIRQFPIGPGSLACWIGPILTLALVGCAQAQTPIRLQAPSAQQMPWTAAIGELDVGSGLGSSGQHCSAVLVAPDTIVTAAHCLFLGSAQAPASPYNLNFYPNKG